VRFQNGSNKVVIELRVVQFWSEIILINNDLVIHRPVKTSDINEQMRDKEPQPSPTHTAEAATQTL